MIQRNYSIPRQGRKPNNSGLQNFLVTLTSNLVLIMTIQGKILLLTAFLPHLSDEEMEA